MRTLVLVGILALGGGVIGCATLEGAAGIKRDAQGNPVSDGTGGILGTLLGMIVPWGTAATATAAGLYANVKRAGWKATAVSTATSVEEWKAQHPEQWAALKEILKDKHERAKVQNYVKVLTGK